GSVPRRLRCRVHADVRRRRATCARRRSAFYDQVVPVQAEPVQVPPVHVPPVQVPPVHVPPVHVPPVHVPPVQVPPVQVPPLQVPSAVHVPPVQVPPAYEAESELHCPFDQPHMTVIGDGGPCDTS